MSPFLNYWPDMILPKCNRHFTVIQLVLLGLSKPSNASLNVYTLISSCDTYLLSLVHQSSSKEVGHPVQLDSIYVHIPQLWEQEDKVAVLCQLNVWHHAITDELLNAKTRNTRQHFGTGVYKDSDCVTKKLQGRARGKGKEEGRGERVVVQGKEW